MVLPQGNYNKEFEDLLYECSRNMALFCKTFMPEAFTKNFSEKIHTPLFNALDDEKIQKLVIAAPRGIGKTSIFNKAYPIREIEFQKRHYIIPISASGAAAREYSENIKNELLFNDDLVSVFGPIKSTDIEAKGSFSVLEWVTSSGIKVMPRGAEQQIRGRQFGNYRPDLFIGDDLENDEAVESEEQRDKLRRWFNAALKNSVDLGAKNWRIVVIGTVLHEDSLLSRLLDPDKYRDWVKIRLELCDANYNSNWPEHLTREQIIVMRDEYKDDGLLDVFYREIRNIPIAIETRGFKPEFFENYVETEDYLNNHPDWEGLVLCDPARTMKDGSCLTAIVGLSINMKRNLIYVRRVKSDMFTPASIVTEMLEMAKEINALVLAPEVTGLEDWIIHPIQDAMNKAGVHHVIVPVRPSTGKKSAKRSAGLIPLYKGGHIRHNKEYCGELEELLLNWPRPKRWDEIDAFANHISALEEGGRFFSAVEDPENIEKEYEELRKYDDEELVYEPLI